jgi:hypothetical protein
VNHIELPLRHEYRFLAMFHEEPGGTIPEGHNRIQLLHGGPVRFILFETDTDPVSEFGQWSCHPEGAFDRWMVRQARMRNKAKTIAHNAPADR